MFARYFPADAQGIVFAVALSLVLAFALIPGGAHDSSSVTNDFSIPQKTVVAELEVLAYVEAARNEIMVSHLLLGRLAEETDSARRASTARMVTTAVGLAHAYLDMALDACATEQSFDLVRELDADMRALQDQVASTGIARGGEVQSL